VWFSPFLSSRVLTSERSLNIQQHLSASVP
jgi:hypothetical protein